MDPEFDFDHIVPERTDFFIAKGRGKEPDFWFVPIDTGIRSALLWAVTKTWRAMRESENGPASYDPSNEYGRDAFLYFPLNSEFATKAHYIRDIGDPEPVADPLKILPSIRFYAVRLWDQEDRMLMAVKQSSDPGRKLRQGLIARLSNNELQIVEEDQFLLANDFDFFIDSSHILIYRHAAFESICGLSEAIKESARENAACIAQQADFIDIMAIAASTSGSVRAARELAAIRKSNYAMSLDRDLLMKSCAKAGICFSEDGGTIHINPEHHLVFLRLLSRKILGSDLRKEGTELFYAANRQSL